MTMLEEIEREKQLIARCEKSLALEKLRKRKADTRNKIELGGLVIKSGMNKFNKATILGALDHAFKLIEENIAYKCLFEATGKNLFL
ncbi:TPA: conjugal transfer protein TraD [Legionella pneumophila]|uniref:conjugal transfer protein TraD n=1 Tax=Legionella pneumophila TaxID=446 RepID=UPI0007707133|nr:conjugal transfer protein TraD [Legionella pneumophila]MCH9125742.1 conjugal transfer protein TraD [Legionella pneumophila serogroup 1]MCH9161271.1 conjugal transfer protein TraD [Legionella pneumophila serogroup 1]MCH9167595.1 conjugal transfer protein TraD [Legionella pneumophila serogroup 1]MCH9176192.1 conjugal transfer protein TraD [Legionella pneumophila serogroup 1]MCH9179506.1 conjugal transfer protein TraD [Legionella pneumophila serogroup 1]